MAGKDGKLESKGGDVVRQGFMIKRSQNKKRFTPVNYKQRWFVLTKHYLIYYDGDGEVSPRDILSFVFFPSARIEIRTLEMRPAALVLRFVKRDEIPATTTADRIFCRFNFAGLMRNARVLYTEFVELIYY